ncbi:MAG: YIP1 family protein [Dehalococcoidia bacterium]|nr:YIP1 family protein [Dehalococcoidia bacterium]MDD5493778.1 YIP1 family protein [Dehalococcoidia bacterium]
MEIWRQLLNLMMRSARLDSSLYEEVETEEAAIGHAVMIALLVSLATGIGMGLAGLIGGSGAIWFLWSLVSGSLASLAGWFAWVLVTYFCGSTFLRGPERVSMAELIRTLGFANSPGIIRILCFIPLIGWIISLASSLWSLAAGIVAVKQTLDFTTGRAVAACMLGWLIYVAVLMLVFFWIPSSFKMIPF